MDKSRQQFEETIKQLSDPSEFESKLKRANNGLNYADQYVDLMWISWQASRESLEVELPVKLPTMDDDSFEEGLCEGYKNAIDDFKQILISNGVKIKKMNNEYNREQMKLGVLYARNHLISAYRANFIEFNESQFAMFMNTLTHISNESIDIELMMDSVLSCNDEAESWIKETLIKHSK
ncbi:TPA: hypothetical protein SMM66_002282 [Proteus mirabilis]|nr:hypothetical protein [Proteus mirabilis]